MTEGNNNSVYGKNWNRFYSHLIESNTTSLWDVEPEQSIVADYSIFKKHFNPDLPVIDFGCGTGIQSCFLSQYFPKVIGLDTSSLVIEKNRASITIKNLMFDVFDGLDIRITQQLHEKHGDVNIYIRGVLHQLKEEDLLNVVKSIKELMGRNGVLYMVELLPELQKHLNTHVGNFSALPVQMKAVFMGSLPPIGIDPNEITALFPKGEFEVIEQGETAIATLLQFDSGESIKIPSAYYLIKRKGVD